MALPSHPLDEVIATAGHDADAIHKAIVESDPFLEVVEQAVEHAHELRPGIKSVSYETQVRMNIAKLLLNEQLPPPE